MKTTLFLISTIAAFLLANDIKTGLKTQGKVEAPAEYPVYHVDSLAARHWSTNQFFTAAYNQNTFEIKAAKHAHEQTGDTKIKAFATMIKTDRETIGSSLQALMQKKGAIAPTDVPVDLESKFKYLNERMGKDFNTKYVGGLVADSKGDMALYAVFAKRSKDADVRSFAKQALALLKTDRDSAQHILHYINTKPAGSW